MALRVGDKAPDFTLVNTQKQEVTLSKQEGPVVLLFFPMAFTSVCTTELCTIRDSYGLYNQFQATVFGLSVDSPFTLDKFKADQQLNYELLSDFNKSVAQAYDTLYEDFVLGLKGVAKRSAFVVDSEGIIQYAEVLESAGDLPDFDAIISTLQKL